MEAQGSVESRASCVTLPLCRHTVIHSTGPFPAILFSVLSNAGCCSSWKTKRQCVGRQHDQTARWPLVEGGTPKLETSSITVLNSLDLS
jgi:hypothetical protein